MSDQLIAPFQMTANRIRGLTISNDFVSLEGAGELSHTLDIDYSIEDEREYHTKRVGIVSLMVSMTTDSDTEKSLSCHLSLEGCFASPASDVSDKEFHVLLKANGCAALYSVARAIIMSITSQALAGGQIILPMINVHKFLEDKDKRKAEAPSK